MAPPVQGEGVTKPDKRAGKKVWVKRKGKGTKGPKGSADKGKGSQASGMQAGSREDGTPTGSKGPGKKGKALRGKEEEGEKSVEPKKAAAVPAAEAKAPKSFFSTPAPSHATQGYPYSTDYADHFETSDRAIRDVEPALYRLATHLGKTKATLRIYDPFYCKGSVRDHFATLGFKTFIHEKRDFYGDVEAGQIPDYDILVTNPPYSGEHKERILSFCIKSGKPWVLLMPNYVANKSYYTDLVKDLVAGRKQAAMEQEGGQAKHTPPPFYVVPAEKYEYNHPDGTGHASSPFFSLWFVYLGDDTGRVFHWWEKKNATTLAKGGGAGEARVLKSVESLKLEKAVPDWKRPNPKQRNKLKRSREQEGDEEE